MIYAYEVELRLTNPNTREARLVTRTEHAYSATDAVIQAVVNQGADPDAGSAEIKVIRVGPPVAAILAATQDLAQQIAEITDRNRRLARTKS